MIAHGETQPNDPSHLERVAAQVYNSEVKCLVQLLAEPGREVSAAGLGHLLREAQSPPDRAHRRTTANVAQMLHDSHVDAGAMVVTHGGSDNAWAVEKPEDSAADDALAGLRLGLSASYGVNLSQFFGSAVAARGSVRGPQIVQNLANFFATSQQGQEFTIQQVADGAYVPYRSARMHLRRLAARGYVQYESSDITEEVPRFALNPGVDPTLSTQTHVGARSAQIPSHAQIPADSRELLGQILTRYQQSEIDVFGPADIAAEFGETRQVSTASLQYLLNTLVREGVIRRLHSIPGEDVFSRISCDSDQKVIMDRAAAIYLGIASNNPDTIREGLEIGREILEDGELVRILLGKSRRRRVPHAVRAKFVLDLLAGQDEGVSTNELYQHLEEGELSIQALWLVLSAMEREGTIEVSRTVRKLRFWRSVVSPEF